MAQLTQQPVINFHLYPSVGEEDWRYVYASAQVRTLEANMLGRSLMVDMANATDFKQALDMLSSTEYALTGSGDLADLEMRLIELRTDVRDLFHELIVEERLANLLRVREDFSNMRLALRRKLTDKPLGIDYCNDGSVPAEQFETIFEQEDYSPLPEHMREAIERGVLAYYQNKDVRQIDYELDKTLFEYLIDQAKILKNTFLTELFMMQIDLLNIRTILRLKYTENDQRDVFIEGGYIGTGKLKRAIDSPWEVIVQLFDATPYNNIVESAVSYLASNNSFLKLEAQCGEHLAGFLRETMQITSGPQPIVAYLILKESEIRSIRLILTAKKNKLDTKLILDRIGG